MKGYAWYAPLLDIGPHVRRRVGNDRSRNKQIGRKPADLQTEHFSQYAEWNGGWRIVEITGVPMHHCRIVQFPHRAVTTDRTFPNAIDP